MLVEVDEPPRSGDEAWPGRDHHPEPRPGQPGADASRSVDKWHLVALANRGPATRHTGPGADELALGLTGKGEVAIARRPIN